jgi:acetyl-CoA carboxylase beta subunit
MNQEKKVYKDWSDTETLIKCDNEECGGYSFEHELEENEWKCPHCRKPILKPE